MARRRSGFAILMVGFVLLVLVLELQPATRVQLLAAGLIGVIVFTYYKGEELLGWKLGSGNEAPPELITAEPTGGIFGTDLPDQAYGEPVIERPAVSLSRSAPPNAPTQTLAVGADDLLTNENPVSQTEPIFRPAPAVESLPPSSPIFKANKQPTSPATLAVATTVEAPSATGNDLGAGVVYDEPTFIELEDYSHDEVVASVKAGEASLLSILIQEKMLSTEGPITDTDVHTMVFVAVSTNDLIRVLLEGKAAEAEAKAHWRDASTPELYQPAVELMESHP